ncbi:extracellular solute-binding protein [Pseudorhodoferax sp. LjRoot39]|uniref:extracellular solute-binding protein n=1 Tax=Pseudorhodoferax sp. LjRoot39 TaxID=3342328 RepID=UPI003ECF7B72
MKIRCLCMAWLVAFLALPAWGAHAYAQFGDIKYGPDFTHFSYVNPNAPKGGEIRMVPPTRPTNFDKFNPFTLRGSAPYGLSQAGLGYSLVFESLLIGNDEERTTAYGLLAEDVEVAADFLSATFRLNPKARFSNGEPVLAADVVHSFEVFTSKYVAPTYPAVYSQVRRVVAVDQRTVRFEFTTPDRSLPLIVGGMPVFSRAWGRGKPFDQVVTDVPIGSGPYRIPSGALGRDTTYVRDPDYWGAELPTRKGQFNFDRVTFKIYLDQTAQFEGLKAGEVDFMREFTSRNWARQYYGRPFDRGDVVKRAFENQNPAMFQATLLNLRRPKFQDIRVRQALGLALDFQWLNRQLFYGIYTRTEDYFPNSEFRARGLPDAAELALLDPLRARLRPEVFGPAVTMPTTEPPGSLRDNLRQARELLQQAGWTYRDGALRNARGEPFTIEYLSDQPSLTRVIAPYQAALRKLGIALTIRNVDYALSQQRMDTFDYEMTSINMMPLGDLAPSGLRELFGSKAAATPGSSNYAGIADPAVDALIDKVGAATTDKEQVASKRALDRVLTHGHYVIPQYHGKAFLIGYRPRPFVLPDSIPPYYEADGWAVSTWWASPDNR